MLMHIVFICMFDGYSLSCICCLCLYAWEYFRSIANVDLI